MQKYIASLALVVAASLLPAASHAQAGPSEAAGSSSRDQTFLDFQVDRPAKPKKPAAPVYPDHLRAQHVEGTVLVQFIVDQRGRPEMQSFKVIKSSHAAMTESVRSAVSDMTFFPAESGGQKVKQLVQLPFTFALNR
jgi:protein TonB